MMDSSDQTKFVQILKGIRESLAQINQLVAGIKETVEGNEDFAQCSSKGISLLDVKNQLLLDYLINLLFVFLQKLNENSIEGDEAIDRLVEIRTVLERIRPIEKKLQYQIDKLVKSSVESKNESSTDYPLGFKPNLAQFGDDDDEESSSDNDEGDEKPVQRAKKDKKYVPPKLVAMPYNDDQSTESRAIERGKKRALSSSLVQDLQQQYSLAPDEIRDDSDNKRNKKISEDLHHRKEYEEEYFVRLQMTKKQKQAAKKTQVSKTMDSLLDFGDYGAMGSTGKKTTGKGSKVSFQKRRHNKSKGKKKSRK